MRERLSTAPPRPRRRLRRTVRAADRPPGAGGAGVLPDRAAHDAGGGHARQGPGRDHPLRRSRLGVRPGAPAVDPALFDAGVPVLGICYGFQAMASALGGVVAHTGAREYGGTSVDVDEAGTLLAGSPGAETVWMSHGDAVHAAPEGFQVLAASEAAPVAAFENAGRRLYGMQWHPEVKHSERGQQTLENFLYHGAGLAPERSEEHTSELQSRGHLVCRLLLEKKNKTTS